MSDEGGSLLTFPCDVAIKAFGLNGAEFRTAAATIVRAHFGETFTTAAQVSRNGTYLSLTITVRAQSRAQLDAVYHALVASDDVLMVL